LGGRVYLSTGENNAQGLEGKSGAQGEGEIKIWVEEERRRFLKEGSREQ